MIVGVLGLLASGYTYARSRRVREPTFAVDPVRTVIASRENVVHAPIVVTRRDGRVVRSDLVAVRFYFWNGGAESIKRENILEPLRIVIMDPHAELLDYQLLRRSRDVTAVSLSATNDTNQLGIDLNILEQNDGVTGQIIFDGSADSDVILVGTIEGARIPSRRDLALRVFWHGFPKAALFIVIGLILLGYGTQRLPRVISPQFDRIDLGAILVTMLMIFTVIITYPDAREMLTAILKSSRSDTRLLTDIIPHNILPR